jgi:hypothetical protein
MWHFKKNEKDQDICMAAAGFIFLAPKMSKEKKQEAFLGQANISKQNINLKSLLYSTFELLNLCLQRNLIGPYCTETSQQVVKLATKQKPFNLYRPATGLIRVAENTNKLRQCVIKVAELLQMSQNTESILFLVCLFNVDPTLTKLCLHP